MLIDVLEHFDYDGGIKLLEECKKIGRNIIISTPKNVAPQKDSFGNPFETHKFQWQKKHFDEFVNKFFIPNEESLICYIGDDAFKVRNDIIRILRIKSKIKEYLLSFLKIPYIVYKTIKK